MSIMITISKEGAGGVLSVVKRFLAHEVDVSENQDQRNERGQVLVGQLTERIMALTLHEKCHKSQALRQVISGDQERLGRLLDGELPGLVRTERFGGLWKGRPHTPRRW